VLKVASDDIARGNAIAAEKLAAASKQFTADASKTLDEVSLRASSSNLKFLYCAKLRLLD
jgi:hypothetical protein